MDSKINRNDICPCGSGLKYKHCCLKRSNNESDTEFKNDSEQAEHLDWLENASKLPFRAEIISEDGKESSMKVLSAKVCSNGIEKELFDDEITLKTNQVPGNKSDNSKAIFTVPQINDSNSKIFIQGNATVENFNSPYKISIKENLKKLKIASTKGLFAIIRVVHRRDCGFDCFDILFGESGREETKDSNGEKQRPHLTIFPDGNNKYFRVANYKCKMEIEMDYDLKSKSIYPIESKVVLDEYSENLILSFEFEKANETVKLIEAKIV